jgi:hypothetical protein
MGRSRRKLRVIHGDVPLLETPRHPTVVSWHHLRRCVCGDVPYHGCRGVTVPSLPSWQSGYRYAPVMLVTRGHGARSHMCTSSRHGPFASPPRRVSL